MAAGGRNRPPPFPTGMKLADRYCVEGLFARTEGRMYYTLSTESSPEDGERFLMTTRWGSNLFEHYEAFHALGLQHPGLAQPTDVFQHGQVLCSVIPYRPELGLLLEECAPFDGERVLRLAVRAAGSLAFLCRHGVVPRSLWEGSFLTMGSGDPSLFDLDIEEVRAQPVPPEDQGRLVQDMTAVLRRFTAPNCAPICGFLDLAESGAFPDILSFGMALQELFPQVSSCEPSFPAAAHTDVGACRDLNEDNWNWCQLTSDIHLFVVADGMGGHANGEVASELAVKTICQVARERIHALAEITTDALENLLDEAFQAANNTVKDIADRRHSDMGTTLVALLLVGDRLALLANVGDSRAYLLRDQALHQVTRDHSLVARLVEQNRLTPDEARRHPNANILLRTVGSERNVDIDIFSVELDHGDRLLLCSDGLWGEVEDEDLQAILNHYQDRRVACRELVRAAHHGGGKDNITLVLVDNLPPGGPST